MFADLAMFPAHLQMLNGSAIAQKRPAEESKEDLDISQRSAAGLTIQQRLNKM